MRLAVLLFLGLAWGQDLARNKQHAQESLRLARAARGEEDMRKRGELLRKAVDEGRQSGVPRVYGTALHELSRHTLRGGNFQEAIEQMQMAAGALRLAGAQIPMAALFRKLGILLQQQGNFEEALAAYKEALSHQERLQVWLPASLTLQHMGLLYARMGKRDQALAQLEKAIVYARQEHAPMQSRARIAFLGCGYELLGEHATSIQIIEGLGPGLPPGVSTCLAAAYFHAGQYAGAERTAAAALPGTAKSTTDDEGEEPGVWNDLMRDRIRALYWRAAARRKLGKLGNPGGALEDLLLAMRQVEEMRSNLVSYDFTKRGFSNLFGDITTLAIDMLHEAGRHQESFEIAEQARARAFLDLLADKQDEGSPITDRFPRLAALTAIPAIASTSKQQAATASEMAAIASRLGSVVVSYWTAPEAVWIWATSPSGRISGFRSNASASALRALLKRASSRKGPPDTDALRSLHRLLIAPVQPLLPKQGVPLLTLIPHGALFEVPFAALVDERGRYLVETHAIHFAPSVAAFGLLAARPRLQGAPMLLVGDIVKPPRLPGGKPLPPLRRSAAEIRSIAAVSGKAALLQRELASLEQVREASQSGSVLHFAGHAVVDNDRPFDSFLALSNGEKLTVRSIYGMNLKAHLVTLSSCRGASGAISADGVLSLARGLFHAGAASVLASVWDVSDESTERMMPRFYQSLRRSGNKASALREAQLYLVNELRHGRISLETAAGPAVLPEHPALWAGFQLQGEPK